MEYVIDSNAVIDYLSGQMPESGMSFMNGIIDESLVVPLTNEIVSATITLRKSHKIKMPDAIIATTAIVLGHTLITRNTSDFKKIDSLKTIDLWSI